MLPRFAFMMAGLLFAGAQRDVPGNVPVSADHSTPSLSFWRLFLIDNHQDLALFA
jgi:hypothetical protein